MSAADAQGQRRAGGPGDIKPVKVEVADGVATVAVNSPPVNAMGAGVLHGLASTARSLAGDDAVRAVVVVGAGTKAFMAGADISEFAELRERPAGMQEHAALAGRMWDAWRALPQPVVAAVQASAVGGGLEFALACDIIVADETAMFGLPEVKLGLIPGGGGTQRLPARVGAAAAKELMLLGSLVDAERARALGLVNRVAPHGQALALAQQLAAEIAARPRVAVQAIKRAVDASRPDLAAGLARERQIFLEVSRSDDFTEGFSAFLEKRAPHFTHS